MDLLVTAIDMFLHVDSVRHLERYRLRVTFDNGVTKDVDLADHLLGEVFEPLKDPKFFRRVRLNPESGTIERPNGADLAPEFLFDIGDTVDQVA